MVKKEMYKYGKIIMNNLMAIYSNIIANKYFSIIQLPFKIKPSQMKYFKNIWDLK